MCPPITSTRYRPPGRGSSQAWPPNQRVSFSGSTRNSQSVSGLAAISTSRSTAVSVVVSMLLLLSDLVANGDRPVGQDVRVDPGPVNQLLDDSGPRQLLQVKARLAELDAETLDLADSETLANEVVQAHAASGELPPGPARRQGDVLDNLLLDERQGIPSRGPT